jgi:hypothetical protein
LRCQRWARVGAEQQTLEARGGTRSVQTRRGSQQTLEEQLDWYKQEEGVVTESD